MAERPDRAPSSRGFDPERILQILDEAGVRYVLIGGLAGTLYGSPHVTTDVDVAPEPSRSNLERLAKALESLDARIRVEGVPDGLEFDRSADMLSRAELLNLTTQAGDLDLAFQPAGTGGYPDLIERAITLDIRGTRVVVAALCPRWAPDRDTPLESRHLHRLLVTRTLFTPRPRVGCGTGSRRSWRLWRRPTRPSRYG